jgi:hypothetical protein
VVQVLLGVGAGGHRCAWVVVVQAHLDGVQVTKGIRAGERHGQFGAVAVQALASQFDLRGEFVMAAVGVAAAHGQLRPQRDARDHQTQQGNDEGDQGHERSLDRFPAPHLANPFIRGRGLVCGNLLEHRAIPALVSTLAFMTTTPTPLMAASNALLLRLLELEESADPARGRLLEDLGRDLPDPLEAWVREQAVRIRTHWRGQGWIAEPGGASLAGNDAFVELASVGRSHAAQVRDLREGVRRDRAVRERVLLYLHTREREGEYPVQLGELDDASSPWAWLADRPLEWERDIERATQYLGGQGMLADTTRIEEAGIVIARLSHRGVQAVEELLDGPAPGGAVGVGPQVVNNHYGDVRGTLVQAHHVHGDISGGQGPDES